MNSVLFKVLVVRFYKINTGFFLLLFLLLFALLDGKSTMQLHYGIMQGITGSWGFCGIAMLVWAVYNLKCISFIMKEIDRPGNSFLFRMQASDNGTQLRALLSCHGAVYLPLLVYAAMTAAVGWHDHHYLAAGVFLLYQLLMCGIATAIYFNRINTTWQQPSFTLPSLDFGGRKTFLFYLLHYSLWSRKATFAGLKLCSLFLLQAMIAANTDKLSKEAICVLIMFLVSAHSLLPVYYVGFIESDMAILRNLPITTSRRMLAYVVTYAIIFLPELAFLLLNTHHVMSLQLILSLYAVAVSQLSLYTSLQYIRGVTQERYMSFVFGLFFVSLLLLASFNLWFLFVAEVVVAVVLFGRLYERYEAV